MSAIVVNSCPRGGFFDGNENFGGPPYRGFMALLCFAPTMFLFLSAAWWAICHRRQQAATPAPVIQQATISNNSNYQTMSDGPSSSSSSSSSLDLDVDDHPVIDDSLYVNSEPNSPYTSSSVMPEPSISPLSLPAPSSSPLSSNITASLLTTSSSSSSSSSSSFHVDDSPPRRVSLSRHTRFLLFCRSLIRPTRLFTSTALFSSVQFLLTLAALLYAMLKGEQCCYGGTGALYAILCLRLCLSYTNIRVAYWQTHSRTNTISVIDKSCQIGYLIHFVWLSFAFVLVSDDGQCASTAPVMFTVSLVSLILLLINFTLFALCTLCSYACQAKSDAVIVMARTCVKYCLIGWSYGKELDLCDAITDVEMEIACLPCVSHAEMQAREKEKHARRRLQEI